MCQSAGEALQFYKNAERRRQHAPTRVHLRAIGCGALRQVRCQEVDSGHVMCRHIRRSRWGPCSRGSTVVFKARAYLNSDRMLWLFWLAIESA